MTFFTPWPDERKMFYGGRFNPTAVSRGKFLLILYEFRPD